MTASTNGLELNASESALLVWNVPNEVVNGFKVPNFEQVIGVTEAHFANVAKHLRSEATGASVLINWTNVRAFRNALQAVLAELGEPEFQTRTGVPLSVGEEVLDRLDTLLREQTLETC